MDGTESTVLSYSVHCLLSKIKRSPGAEHCILIALTVGNPLSFFISQQFLTLWGAPWKSPTLTLHLSPSGRWQSTPSGHNYVFLCPVFCGNGQTFKPCLPILGQGPGQRTGRAMPMVSSYALTAFLATTSISLGFLTTAPVWAVSSTKGVHLGGKTSKKKTSYFN